MPFIICHQFHSKLIKINFYTSFGAWCLHFFIRLMILNILRTNIVEIFFCFDPENNFFMLAVKIIINPSILRQLFPKLREGTSEEKIFSFMPYKHLNRLRGNACYCSSFNTFNLETVAILWF